MTKTVHLIDDDASLRGALQERLLGTGLAVESYDRAEAFLQVAGFQPADHIVLSDIFMPGMTGLELLDAIRDEGSELPVVFMTGFGDIPLAVEAMRKGATTFLEKPVQPSALDEALERAFAVGRNEGFGAKIATLSKRELQVLKAGCADRSVKQTGLDLGISFRTVEHHRVAIRQKLDIDTFPEVVECYRTYRDRLSEENAHDPDP